MRGKVSKFGLEDRLKLNRGNELRLCFYCDKYKSVMNFWLATNNKFLSRKCKDCMRK